MKEIMSTKEEGKDIGAELQNYQMDESARDLIKQLLAFDPAQRLTNPVAIKKHRWFQNFDFVSSFIVIIFFDLFRIL
jgi:serine/threonine protein kinase